MFINWCRIALFTTVLLGIGGLNAQDVVTNSPEFQRGRLLYVRHCLICHMGSGQGQRGTYPPLANSDFLMADSERAIRAVVSGLSGLIQVNGVDYENSMPAIVLDDQDVADVMTFVRNSWGNTSEVVDPGTVTRVRSTTQFQTYEDLVKAGRYPPLPSAPKGFVIREVARLNGFPVRLASDGVSNPFLVLTQDGEVLSVDVVTGQTVALARAADYADFAIGIPSTRGMTVGPDGHLYVTSNQQDERAQTVMNETTVFRSTRSIDQLPLELSVWYRTNYPFGVGPYNHGISEIAFGPDGFVYVASGSRTDGNEEGNSPRFSRFGETPITAGIWRIDPNVEPPRMEMFARGLRNVFGFDWNGDEELFSVSNGPDAHAPEEMDHIVRGGHYGFPFQFADWINKPYAHTPDAPEGLEIRLPVANSGPGAGGSPSHPLFTFDAHSSPAGMVWLDENWPEGFQNCLLITRFGNLLALGNDVGFDLLRARLVRADDGRYSAQMETILAPLGRPIDVHVHRGSIYVAEYTRPTNHKSGLGWLPGRIIELKPSWAGQTQIR